MTTEVDLLNTIHEYADMGLSGLNQVIPLSSDPSFTRELQHQKSDYEEMVFQGSNMGITELTKGINDYHGEDKAVLSFAEKQLKQEEHHAETMKQYL